MPAATSIVAAPLAHIALPNNERLESRADVILRTCVIIISLELIAPRKLPRRRRSDTRVRKLYLIYRNKFRLQFSGLHRCISAVLRHSAHGRAEARSMASFEVTASARVMKLIGPPMVMAASCWRALISV